jgi:hypothetical protein
MRTLDLLLGALGLLVLSAVVVWGLDLDRLARCGPRWRRRLVGAGLVLLALTGTPALLAPAEAWAAKNDALSGSAKWKQIATTWREAEAIASGKRGAYPFDRAGKKRMLERLRRCGDKIEALRKAGQISAPGAGLLIKDLQLLTRGVQGKRAKSMRMATCYEPMPHFPARDGLKRLKERLPLLEQLSRVKRVQPAVLAKVLLTVERDLALLARKEMRARFAGKQRQEVARLCKRASALVKRLKR